MLLIELLRNKSLSYAKNLCKKEAVPIRNDVNLHMVPTSFCKIGPLTQNIRLNLVGCSVSRATATSETGAISSIKQSGLSRKEGTSSWAQ